MASVLLPMTLHPLRGHLSTLVRGEEVSQVARTML
jgi:hypothetical protein